MHFGSACETLSHFGYKRSYSHYQKFRREQVFNRKQHLPDQINIDTSVAFAVKFDRAVPKMGQNEPFGLQLDHELAKTRPSCVSIREYVKYRSLTFWKTGSLSGNEIEINRDIISIPCLLPKKAGWGNAVRFRVTVSPLRPSFASLSGHCQCPPRLKLKCECIVESVRNIERNFWMNMSGDIIETLIVAGIYNLRRLQIKRCGRLGLRAVLALDCCPVITRNVHMELF